MILRRLFPVLVPFAFLAACGGSAFTTEPGDGDGGAGDGDGDAGDGDAGDGDGDGDVGDGDGDGDIPPPVAIEGRCQSDSDCLAVSLTSDPCYSPGCEAPLAGSKEDVANNECLLPWMDLMAPMTPDECRGEDSGAPCPGACALPPTCIHAYCDAGTCKLELDYEGNDCSDPGAEDPDCEELDQAREDALFAARECDSSGSGIVCARDRIADECGCAVPVNSQNGDQIDAAEEAYDAWNAECEPPEYCNAIDCAGPTSKALCTSDGSLGDGLCSY